MMDVCFLQLVVVRLHHGMHAVGPVALQERLSSHERSVVFAIRALLVYAVLVGLLVLLGLVLVVVVVPNGIVSCRGGPLTVGCVFREFALIQLFNWYSMDRRSYPEASSC